VRDCSEYQNWSLQISFCGETLTWNSDGTGNGNSGWGGRLNFAKGADEGGCCWFGQGNICDENNNRFTGPNGGYICMGTDGLGYNCNVYVSPQLHVDGSCKCSTHIGILAVGPSADCNSTSCIRFFEADIIDGQLYNISRFIDGGACGCDDEISVSIIYSP
jgi:hypothetical protein